MIMNDQLINKFIKENKLHKQEKGSFEFHVNRFEVVKRTLSDIRMASNSKIPKLLDVCSGPLHFSSIASMMGYKVSAFDFDEVLNDRHVKERARRYNISLKTGDLANGLAKYPANYFDVATLFEALEHFNFNPVPIIKEIHKALRPKGKLILTTPNLFRLGYKLRILFNRHAVISIEQPVVGHWREFSVKEMKKLMSLGGFSKFKITYFNYDIPTNNIIVKLFKKAMTSVFPSLSGNILVIAEK